MYSIYYNKVGNDISENNTGWITDGTHENVEATIKVMIEDEIYVRSDMITSIEVKDYLITIKYTDWGNKPEVIYWHLVPCKMV